LDAHAARGSLPERPLFFYGPFYELRWCVKPCAVIREGDWLLIGIRFFKEFLSVRRS
jgi:hypothetical protein